MDGDLCALPEILEVPKRCGARLLIDEAHSTFLYGENGRGIAHFGTSATGEDRAVSLTVQKLVAKILA